MGGKPQALLLPLPRELQARPDRWLVPPEPVVALGSAHPGLQQAAQGLIQDLAAHGLRPRLRVAGDGSVVPGEAEITLFVDSEIHPHPQGYRLAVEPGGVSVIGRDEAGLFYGLQTLRQWLQIRGLVKEGWYPALAGVRITDWPTFRHRGVLLDVSRDKVPTMETLYQLVDLLASWKINQLQLYMEHTFAYRGHEIVWQDASPFTPEEIRALDAYCQERFIELVPNQNSFGHFHRWLRHDKYRHLAECPAGVDHPFGEEREPFSLCPLDPGALALLRDLYDQLLPNFSSPQFHAGFDETFDLGLCRSAEACAERGKGEVYLDFLLKVHDLVQERGRRMQFWADILLEEPDLIPRLPPEAIPMVWGYEEDFSFRDQTASLRSAGLQFYVCPGTSSWCSLAGRTDNALVNLTKAASLTQTEGSIGYLITDWGDFGHLQPLPVSFLGFAAGAGVSWHRQTLNHPYEKAIGPLLDLYAFRDRAGVMGGLACELGNVYRKLQAPNRNGSVLFHLLLFPHDGLRHPRFGTLKAFDLRLTGAEIELIMRPLSEARMDRPDAQLIVREFRWVADLLTLACNLGATRLEAGPDVPISALPEGDRAPLAQELGRLIEEHREIWLARNRPGGLRDSSARLERLLVLLQGGG